MAFVKAISALDIAEGEMKRVVLQGKEIAVAKVGQDFLAFDDICTHEYCPLSDGSLEGSIVTCPCHGSRFDIRSGDVLNLPAAVPIKTFKVKVVKVENGDVLVDL